MAALSPKDRIRQLAIFVVTGKRLDDADGIGDEWDRLDGKGDLSDALEEIRSGGYETGIPCDTSRNFETRSVAARMLDGSWVGWTYWFGGGKHAEPRLLSWLEDAYDLDAREEVVTRLVFTRKPK